jgi:hypothetical protein
MKKIRICGSFKSAEKLCPHLQLANLQIAKKIGFANCNIATFEKVAYF